MIRYGTVCVPRGFVGAFCVLVSHKGRAPFDSNAAESPGLIASNTYALPSWNGDMTTMIVTMMTMTMMLDVR